MSKVNDASRPAAPATDAEGERLRAALRTIARGDIGPVSCLGAIVAAMQAFARDALVASPAPAPQAVEEVRREAAEDERDRLYAAANAEIEVFASFASKEARRFLRQMGAMLPADRQRARAGQDGGA